MSDQATKDPTLVRLGSAVRDRRKEMGLTQFELAMACIPPVTPGTIHRLEIGVQRPSITTLTVIAVALNSSVDELNGDVA